MDEPYIPDTNFSITEEDDEEEEEEIHLQLQSSGRSSGSTQNMQKQDESASKPPVVRRTSRSYSVTRSQKPSISADVKEDQQNHFFPIRPEQDSSILGSEEYGNPKTLINQLKKEAESTSIHDDSSSKVRLQDYLHSEDVDEQVICLLCKNQDIPADTLQTLWKVFLELNDVQTSSLWDGAFDLPYQDKLHDACESLTSFGPAFQKQFIRKGIEQLSTHFCKRRNLSDGSSIPKLLVPLFYVFPPKEMQVAEIEVEGSGSPAIEDFNLYAHGLYQIVQSFAPWNFTTHSDASKCMKLLFRMLCNYHDPKLSCFLERHQVDISKVFYPLIEHLFVGHSSDDLVSYLWTMFMVYKDPAMPILFMISLIISRRESIMEQVPSGNSEWKSTALGLLHFQSQAHIRDVLSDAEIISTITPRGFKFYYDVITNPASYENGDLVSKFLSMACFPLTEVEVISSNQITRHRADESVKYFVVDCRPAEEFRAGRIATAFHLDPSFLLKDKETMEKTISGFVSMIRDDHICFYGSGDPEKDYDMNTIIFQFLSHGVHHVGLLSGGYEGLHNMFDKNQVDFEDHHPAKCLVCQKRYKSRATPPSQGSEFGKQFASMTLNVKGKIETGLKDRLSSVKAKVSDTNRAQVQASVSESWSKLGKSLSSSLAKTSVPKPSISRVWKTSEEEPAKNPRTMQTI
eukprot:TRINITY_DN3691_c0_g1_i2.p1 TRINITY_DN3691_c0_g1~~TRINITY_DN3691_c0_g1_i2.p1  ORF type:complete len:686 (+),score=133.66 TRINITY_DN3691_c0_g1_i2:58-2115(+)